MYERKRGSVVGAPLLAVFILVLVGVSFWLGRISASETGRDGEPQRADAEGTTGAGEKALAAEDGGGGSDADEAAERLVAARDDGTSDEIAGPEASLREEAAEPSQGELRRLSVPIRGSLAASIVNEVGRDHGDALAQVTGRLLVWWLDLSRDLRAGDRLHLIYELPEDSEPLVHAMRFESQRLGREIRAYRFHPPGEAFARYYDEDGKEIELRLRNQPIEEYEQITSLLRDGRRHAGVDFKAPVGTPVYSPFAGVVRRKNFNTRVNGLSVELEDNQGRRILFLHLSEVDEKMRPGARVAAGQRVGLSGNTGRSTAPHLHYQLMSRSGKVLDPFEVQETYRRSLAGQHRALYTEHRRAFDGKLQALAAAGQPSVEAN